MTIYYINTPKSFPEVNATSLDQVIAELDKYESDAYLHVFEEGPDGNRIVYYGYPEAIRSKHHFTKDYMDMATSNLGDRK